MNLIALHNEALGLGVAEPLTPPAIERLSMLQCPTLLVVGELDQPRTLEANQWMTTQIANVNHQSIAGAAHLPSMERPDEFQQIVQHYGGLTAS